MSTVATTTCPIWDTPADVGPAGDGLIVRSSRAGGEYRISGTALSMLSHFTPEQKARLTTWIVDQRRFNESVPMVNSETLREVRARRPLKMSERKNRFFLSLIDLGVSPDFKLKFRGVVDEERNRNRYFLSAWLEFSRDSELAAFVQLLMAEGLVVDADGSVVLTPRGWERLEEIESGSSDSLQGFCAMWFDPSMDMVFSDGMAPAIEAAGYRAFRVDRKEHINKIDDEIVSEIRRSRFVVADATCGVTTGEGHKIGVARGGVYYEAGLAHGLAIPVIWTCREDCMPFVHFDTRQFAHIIWTSPEDLRVKLFNRIGHVIGLGSSAT